MEPDERRFYETTIDKLFVSTLINVARDPAAPVLSPTRVWPLLEAVESTLKRLLFEVKSLTPREYEYVKSGLIGLLADRKLAFQVEIGDAGSEQGCVEVQTVERSLRLAGMDFPQNRP